MLNQLRHLHLSLLKILVLSTLYSLMVACSPNLTIIGTIDETLIITKEKIHEIGFEAFKRDYLGKEVTIEGLEHIAHGGGFNPDKGQCNIDYGTLAAFKNGRFHIENPIAVKIYANSTPSYALKQRFSKGSYIEGGLDYDQEINLPMIVCDKCEWNPGDKKCFYKSPSTTITGKIIKVGVADERISMVIRPKGLAY